MLRLLVLIISINAISFFTGFAQAIELPRSVFPADTLTLGKLSTDSSGNIYALGFLNRFFRAHLYQLSPFSTIIRSTDSLRSWQFIPLPASIRAITSLAHTKSQLVAVGYSAHPDSLGHPRLLTSNTQGRSWNVRHILSTIASIDLAVEGKGTILVAVNELASPQNLSGVGPMTRATVRAARILRSDDDGVSWKSLISYSTVASVYDIKTNGRGLIVAATEAPPDIGFFAVLPLYNGGGEILSSFDNGVSWNRLPVNPERFPFPARFIWHMDIIPFPSQEQPSILTLGEGISSSTNGTLWNIRLTSSNGRNFTHASQVIYFQDNSNLFKYDLRSRERTILFQERFPFSVFATLYYNGALYGSVGASSIYRFAEQPTTSVLTSPQARSLALALFPNPTDHSSVLTLSLATPATVRYEVLDMLGRVVFSSPEQERSAGEQSIVVSTEQFPSGVYAVRVLTRSAVGLRTETARLLVVR
ncbi:MAG: T9SS C-terminal target domain-containing protein [Candidatus Kapaibacterium sp.]|nr:MAG: T9SS C-terminal target domain-containing protein [Candidatus Kapabacteria bacterium]